MPYVSPLIFYARERERCETIQCIGFHNFAVMMGREDFLNQSRNLTFIANKEANENLRSGVWVSFPSSCGGKEQQEQICICLLVCFCWQGFSLLREDLLRFGIIGMALQGPFVGWDYEQHPRHLTPHGAFYYVITHGGARENFGRSVDRGTGHLVYRRDYNFVRNYGDMEYVPAVLDWRYNATNTSLPSLCGANTYLGDSANIYLISQCYCKRGYEGNPYLPGGCQDIDECSNSALNSCEGICLNTPGGYSCWKLPNNDNSRTKVIIAGTCSGLGVLLLLICSWLLWQEVNKRKEANLKEKFFKRNGGLLLHQQLSSHKGTFETTKLFTSKELEKATDNYNANRILGQGGQGTVYKGMLTDGRIVAIKKSKVLDDGKLEQFINEVVILSQINHRNVVKLFGCCLETEVPMLVYEFVHNGTLFHYIHDQNEEFPLTWDLRLRIITEIAGALSYLHSAASIAIYHRDIKSTNILLDEKFRAKVSDFGISRSISVDKTHLTTAVQGTFGYLDPEYFQSSQFTEKSDVYSFGVVLVELLTGKMPILSAKSDERGSLTACFLFKMKENRLFDILDARVVQEGGKEAIWTVATVAARCLQLNGSNRPTMKEVLVELDGIRMSNGASATGKHSCQDVEYSTDDFLTGPWEAASTSTGSFCSTSLYPTSVV